MFSILRFMFLSVVIDGTLGDFKMKKLIIMACTLMLSSSLCATTYTYDRLLQSVMGTGEKIELKIGDFIDFENGYTMEIKGDETNFKAFGMTLEEIKNKVDTIEKQTSVEYFNV